MQPHSISTMEGLREIYGSPPPNSLAVRCVLPSLDKHHQAFIALSPFIVISSTGAQGMPDVSPRGDLPGFVTVLDEHTLLIPDRPGNKKLLTMSNIMENPNIALLFFIPGRVDTLRVTGEARVTEDPTVLGPLAVQGQIPKTALAVTVQQAWLHCGKALIRSRLWEQEAQVAPDALPTLGQMCAAQIAGLDVVEAEARIETNNNHRLWGDPVEKFGIYLSPREHKVVRIDSSWWIPEPPEWVYVTNDVDAALPEIRRIVEEKSLADEPGTVSWGQIPEGLRP